MNAATLILVGLSLVTLVRAREWPDHTSKPLVLVGGISMYGKNDGHNAGTLACGGPLLADSHHVAIRECRGRCGAPAVVCSAATARCVRTTVRDSGPWGAVRDGAWEVQIRLRPGWRRRACVDVTRAVWRELGQPAAMSGVVVWVEERP